LTDEIRIERLADLDEHLARIETSAADDELRRERASLGTVVGMASTAFAPQPTRGSRTSPRAATAAS